MRSRRIEFTLQNDSADVIEVDSNWIREFALNRFVVRTQYEYGYISRNLMQTVVIIRNKYICHLMAKNEP